MSVLNSLISHKKEHFPVISFHPWINQRSCDCFFSSFSRVFWVNDVMAISIMSSFRGGKCCSIMSSKWRKAWRTPFSGNIVPAWAHIFPQRPPLKCSGGWNWLSCFYYWSNSHFWIYLAVRNINPLQSGVQIYYKTRFCSRKHIFMCVCVCVCCITTWIMFPCLPAFPQYCTSTVLFLQVPSCWSSSIC